MAPPEAAPAPTMVCSSSMKTTAFSFSSRALQHRLEALLEVAAVAGAGHQRAHVQGVDGGPLQRVGGLAQLDLAEIRSGCWFWVLG